MSAAPAVAPLVPHDGDKTIPLLGLGTWKSKPGEVYNAVKYAILEAGYRHIDCAYVYQNEEEVGRALKEVISSGAVKREELFITSKCWNTFHSKDLVRPACEKSLQLLQLDYLDLYLIHWPFGFQEGGDLYPQNEDKTACITSDVDYLETWKGMEEVHAAGLARSIGVSNFNHKQIDRIFENSKVKPSCNQVESHPYLVGQKLIDYCKSKGITVVAYSPLGSPDRPWAKPGDPSLLEEPAIVEIAKRHNKEPAQVLIKFQAQRGVVVIPKSVTPARIKSNMQVFDFTLSDDEMKTIASFDRNYRFCPLDQYKEHQYYGFNEEY